jgi:flotillin
MAEIFSFGTLGVVASIVLLVLFMFTMLVRQYRRCPSNRILVVYGKVAGQRAAKCMHGGGTFIVPLLQSYAYLNLEPMTIEIDLAAALSKKNIRVNVPSTFTIGISTEPDIMNNAAERLLGLTEQEVAAQARDIILGQMRLVIATLSIEEINQDREKFLDLVNKNVSIEVNKIGLELINVNVRDITDESGYIEALGRKAASEAINQARWRGSWWRAAPA